MLISDNYPTKVTGCSLIVTLPDVGFISCPQTLDIRMSWPGPRLEFRVPAVAFQPIGRALPQYSHEYGMSWTGGEDESRSKLKLRRFNSVTGLMEMPIAEGNDTIAPDWPACYLGRPMRRSCEARGHRVARGTRDTVGRSDRQRS